MADKDQLQWEQHNRDEAEARQVQQDAAGDTHSPVVAPGPHGSPEMSAQLREAVLAERQRCARLAATWPVDTGLATGLDAVNERDRRVAQLVIDAIVAAIHSDQEPG